MASLAGKDVQFFANDTVVTGGLWKMAVCSIDNSLSRQKTETTVITKCGSETTPGTDDDSISLSLTFMTTAPDADELRASDLEKIYNNESEFQWMIADAYPSASYLSKQGYGVITALEESYPAEGLVQYDFTIKVNGSVVVNVPA